MADQQHCTSLVRPEHDAMAMECNIDKLNNDLLIAILSHLSVTEAAKTCLVSRRWRYLWQYTTGRFEIYDSDKRTRVPERAREFMKLVNRVLNLHQGSTLDQFRVGFCYFHCWPIFDRWFKFAIQKQVKVFELNLAVEIWEGLSVGWIQCVFPDINTLLFSSGEVEFSRFCFHLKSLTLINVGVKEEIIHFFLSNCPCLEQVCVSLSNCLQNLKVMGSLPSLKSMEISWCYGVESLEVDASNLKSFTYIGPDLLVVPFQNVPELFELTIGREYCCSFIFNGDKHTSYSSKLRKLKLMLPFEVMCSSRHLFTYPNNLPVLDDLRELELDFEIRAGESLLFFTFLTKVSPLLYSFTARITYTGILAEDRHTDDTTQLATHFVHKHLKVVKLIGFTGCTSDFELALRLLEIGRDSLEKIILQPTNDSIHQEVSRMASIEKQSKQLEAKLPPGVELVML